MTFDPVETISPNNTTSLTQVERIVQHMFDHPERHWWFAGDFMQPRLSNKHKHFVGYEASARMSDTVSMFNADDKPKLFVVRRKEKFRMVQVNWLAFPECLKAYPRLIKLAEGTDILRRFEGLADRVQEYKPKPPKPKFKSYG